VLARAPAATLRLGTMGGRKRCALLVGSQFAVASLPVAVIVLFAQRDNTRGFARPILRSMRRGQWSTARAPAPDPEIVAASLPNPGIKGVTTGLHPWQFAGSRPQLHGRWATASVTVESIGIADIFP
jgi:hypothetical protein